LCYKLSVNRCSQARSWESKALYIVFLQLRIKAFNYSLGNNAGKLGFTHSCSGAAKCETNVMDVLTN